MLILIRLELIVYILADSMLNVPDVQKNRTDIITEFYPQWSIQSRCVCHAKSMINSINITLSLDPASSSPCRDG